MHGNKRHMHRGDTHTDNTCAGRQQTHTHRDYTLTLRQQTCTQGAQAVPRHGSVSQRGWDENLWPLRFYNIQT